MEEQNSYEVTSPAPEPQESPESTLPFVDLIYGLLFSPAATFRKISGRPPLGHAFIVFTAVTLISTLITVWVPPVSPEMTPEMPPEMARMMLSITPYVGLLGALLAFLNWFILAGVFQLFSEFLNGRGKALGVFTVLGLAELPQVFSSPVYLLTSLSGQSVLSTFLTISTGLLIFIWRLILIVIGLREIHGYSTGRAVITVLAPGLVLLLVALVTVVALVGMIIPIFRFMPE